MWNNIDVNNGWNWLSTQYMRCFLLFYVKQLRFKTVKYKICAYILNLVGFNSELFTANMRSKQRTYCVHSQFQMVSRSILFHFLEW
jgi:hypothetical protein